MTALWIVTGIVGSFFVYHFVRGFIEGLGLRRKPKFRVIHFDEEE
jgi:hypothetical protein